MSARPQVAALPDGRRLRLQDGPIDLILQAYGPWDEVRIAYAAAERRFTGLLDELCTELPQLRTRVNTVPTALRGNVARRMHAAAAPYASEHFITPMAAVAGAVAEEILIAMIGMSRLDRAYVNNGGDIALHLSAGEQFVAGLIDRPDRPSLTGRTVIEFINRTRGIATSGWRGRSFSFGIADAVTVLARTAAQADAAATIIANAVDLPEHRGVLRRPACELQPDSDLGTRLVTRHVPALSADEIETALANGEVRARELSVRGLIDGAALHLQGVTRVVRSNTAIVAAA